MNIQAQIDPPETTPPGDPIEHKILHLLRIYPRISPSMMQIGIGSSLPVSIWRPILSRLIEEGKIREDFIVSPSSTGRQQSHTVLSLAEPNTTDINTTKI